MANHERKLENLNDAPRGEPRPCLKCGSIFQPTAQRWRLCRDCYNANRTESDYTTTYAHPSER